MVRLPAICLSIFHLVLFSYTPKVEAAKGGAAALANSKVVIMLAGITRAVIRKKNPAKTAHRIGDFTIVPRDFLLRPPVMMRMPRVKI